MKFTSEIALDIETMVKDIQKFHIANLYITYYVYDGDKVKELTNEREENESKNPVKSFP